MNRKLLLLVILLFTFNFLDAQVVSNFQQNSINFCGQNSLLTIEDISTGPVVTRIWSVDGPVGFTSFSGTNINESVVLTQLGSYSVKLEVCDAFGTCDEVTRAVLVNGLPTAVITIDDSIVCYGKEVIFSSGSSVFNTFGAQFFWDNDNDDDLDENTPSFTFLATADIEVMLVVQDDNGCADSAFQKLFIVQNNEAVFASENQCAGVPFDLTTSATLNNAALDSIYWVVDSTYYLYGESQTYTHPVEDSIAIILYVVDNYGCRDGMLRFVKIEETPNLSTNFSDTTICEGTETLLVAEGANIYNWSNGETSDSIRITPTENVTYSVYGTSQSGTCISNDLEVELAIIKKPTLTFDSRNFNPLAGTPSEITVDYDPKFATNDSLFWLAHGTSNELLNNTGFENGFIANETVTFPVELVYYKDGYRCTTEESVKFEVDNDCNKNNVYIVNAFTPNGDNLNDEFLISGYNVAEIIELNILNRSGQKVFHEQNLEMINGKMHKGWNGNNLNNVKCNSGVYIYSCKIKCLNGAELEYSGNITLVR